MKNKFFDTPFWVGIIIILIACAFDVMALPKYNISGNSVYFNDNKVFLNVTPHTLVGSGWVTIDLISKQYSGGVTALIGVEWPEMKATALERYNPHYEWRGYICNRTGTWYNYTTNPKHFWCWENITTYDENNQTNGTIPVLLFEHDFEQYNLSLKAVYWQELINWSSVNANVNVINKEYDGKNKWYAITGLNVNAGQSYKVRVYFDVPRCKINAECPVYKYDFGIMPSSYDLTPQGLHEAINNNHLYFIDPWTRGTNNLLFYYTFDNNTFNSYNNLNNLVNYNTINTTGIIKDARSFDGSGDYLTNSSFYTSDYFDNISKFTVNFWASVNTTSFKMIIISRIESESKHFHIASSTSKILQVCLYNSSGSGYCLDSGSYALTSSLQMFTVIYNNSNLTIYRNGSIIASTNLNPISSLSSVNNATLRIGRNTNLSTTQDFYGVIDEIGIWNDVLSSDEINYLYNNGTPTSLQQPPFYNEPYFTENLTTQTISHNENLSYDVNCTSNLNLTYGVNNSMVSIDNETGLITDNPNILETGEYNITVWCYDGITNVTSSFIYNITNAAPVIQSASILPSIAYVNDTLLGYCNATDAEGDNLIYNYAWYLNGVLNNSGIYPNSSSICYQYNSSNSGICNNPRSVNSSHNELFGYYESSHPVWHSQDNNETTYLMFYGQVGITEGFGEIVDTWFAPSVLNSEPIFKIDFDIMNTGDCYPYELDNCGTSKNYTIPMDCVSYNNGITTSILISGDGSGPTYNNKLTISCYNYTMHNYIDIGFESEINNTYSSLVIWDYGVYFNNSNYLYQNTNFLVSNIKQGLSKHQNWTFSCQANDTQAVSSWLNSSTLEISNRVPVFEQIVPNFTISHTSTLVWDVNCSDADNDIITYSSHLVDFPHIDSSTGVITENFSTLDMTGYPDGMFYNRWIGCSDGEYQTNSSYNLNITNARPVTSTPVLNVSVAYKTTTSINCSNTTTTDADNDSIIFYYKWFKNGINTGITTSYITNASFNHFDNLTCEITPSDVWSNGTPVNSSVLQISNTPPVTSAPSISPNPAYNNDALTCNNANVSDIDGDSITWVYLWYVNDSSTGVTTQVLDTNYYNKNDVVICQISAYDGTDYSTYYNSTPLTISNSVPVMQSVRLNSLTNTTSSYLELYCNASDADNDNLRYHWFLYNSSGIYSTENHNIALVAQGSEYNVENATVVYGNYTLTCKADDLTSNSSYMNSTALLILGIYNVTNTSNNTVYETTTNNFILNVTNDEGDVNATFEYNNTVYNVTETRIINSYVFNVSVPTPLIDVNNTLIPYRWNWTYYRNNTINSDSYSNNQTVYIAYIPYNFVVTNTNLVETQPLPYYLIVTNYTSNALLNAIIQVNNTNYTSNSFTTYSTNNIIQNSSIPLNYLLSNNTNFNVTVYLNVSFGGVTKTRNNFTYINNCYQETANVSTTCGSLATGSYYSTLTNPTYAYDGNMSTYGYSSSGIKYLYVNYSIPTNVRKEQTIWQIVPESDTPINVTLLNNCSNGSIIQLRADSDYSNTKTIWNCYDGSNWNALYVYNGSRKIYDEGIWWNIEWPIYTVTQYVMDFTNCSAANSTHNLAYTLYFKDSDTDASVNVISGSGLTINYWTYNNTLTKNKTFYFSNTSSYKLCSYPSSVSNYTTNYTTILYATGYNSLTSIENDIITPIIINFSLQSESNYSYINIHVLDYDDNPVGAGVYNVRQYYYNELLGTYSYIAAATVDYVGITKFAVNPAKYYDFRVYNGTTLVASTGRIKPTLSDYYIRISNLIDTPSHNILSLDDISHVLYGTNVGNYCEFNWTDTINLSSKMCLRVINTTYGSSIPIISYECSSNSSGRLVYSLTNTSGNSYQCQAVMQASNDGLYYVIDTVNVEYENISDIIKTDGLIIGFIIVGSVFFLGLWNPSVSLLLGSVAFIMLTIMGLISLPSMVIGGAIMVVAIIVSIQLRV